MTFFKSVPQENREKFRESLSSFFIAVVVISLAVGCFINEINLSGVQYYKYFTFDRIVISFH